MNPKYTLKLQTNEATRVKIVLSRPEKAWKKQIGMNLVGSMMGFYVFKAGQPVAQQNILNREGTKFVPWNEINEEIMLEPEVDGYRIMPATYEPKIAGPFILSVATDVEFTLVDEEKD